MVSIDVVVVLSAKERTKMRTLSKVELDQVAAGTLPVFSVSGEWGAKVFVPPIVTPPPPPAYSEMTLRDDFVPPSGGPY
jgi:hypothetical protein